MLVDVSGIRWRWGSCTGARHSNPCRVRRSLKLPSSRTRDGAGAPERETMVGAPRDGNVESCKATRPRARVHAYIPGYSRQESAGTGVTLAIGAHSMAFVLPPSTEERRRVTSPLSRHAQWRLDPGAHTEGRAAVLGRRALRTYCCQATYASSPALAPRPASRHATAESRS